MLEIATDGSQSSKTLDGGWAFVIDGVGYWGYEPNTTNQRMELLACIKALEHVVLKYEFGVEVKLVTDSSYVRNCFKQKWHEAWVKSGWVNSSKKPVANRDLWERLIRLDQVLIPHWIHTKGHQNRHAGNTEADRLAVKARLERSNGRT